MLSSGRTVSEANLTFYSGELPRGFSPPSMQGFTAGVFPVAKTTVLRVLYTRGNMPSCRSWKGPVSHSAERSASQARQSLGACKRITLYTRQCASCRRGHKRAVMLQYMEQFRIVLLIFKVTAPAIEHASRSMVQGAQFSWNDPHLLHRK